MRRTTTRTDEERRSFCLSKGIDPSQHCCLDMAWFISDPVEWESQGAKPVMTWIEAWNEYNIAVCCQDDNGRILFYSGAPFTFARGVVNGCPTRLATNGTRLYTIWATTTQVKRTSLKSSTPTGG